MYDFTAVLDELTRNTYVMVIVHDPTIRKSSILSPWCCHTDLRTEAAALKMNIRLARRKFEQLQNDSIVC